MKILPQTTAAKFRLLLFFILLGIAWFFFRPDRVGTYQLSEKREGDILFQSLPHAPLVDAIEGVTNSEWSHCGLLFKSPQGKWVVAEAIGEVQYTPLQEWILRSRRMKIASYRVKNLPKDSEPALKQGVEAFLGKPYDFNYAPEDAEIYCSELVYKVYDRALGIKIGEWEKLGDLNWKAHEVFIRSIQGGKLPLDRPMITPVGLTRSPLVEKVF